MIPRVEYTLPLGFYFKILFGSKKSDEEIFRRKLCDNCSVYYVNKARTGLRLLLSSISKKKLRIGVQAYTCNTVFQSIINAGHEIVFLDINENFGLDLEFLLKKIKQIDVLIVTHVFGFPDNLVKIKEIAGQKIIIEDCSHAFMSRYNNMPVGTYGDAAIFSFGTGKLPPIGTGGMVLINNNKKFPDFDFLFNSLPNESLFSGFFLWLKLVINVFLLHDPFYGRIVYKIKKHLQTKNDSKNKLVFHESRGYKFCERIIYSNYKYFEEIVRKNRLNYLFLKEKCKILSFTGIINTDPNFYIIPVLTNQRDYLHSILTKNKIETGRHFHNSANQAKYLGYSNDCKGVEKITKTILTIPAYYSLNEKKLTKIAVLLNATKIL